MKRISGTFDQKIFVSVVVLVDKNSKHLECTNCRLPICVFLLESHCAKSSNTILSTTHHIIAQRRLLLWRHTLLRTNCVINSESLLFLFGTIFEKRYKACIPAPARPRPVLRRLRVYVQ